MKNGSVLGWLLGIIIVVLIGFGIIYFTKNSMFEKNPPTIFIKEPIYWNLQEPLKVKIKDDSGLKEIKAYLSDTNNSVEIVNKSFDKLTKEYILEIVFPKISPLNKSKNLKLTIEVTDISKWNFTFGNSNKLVTTIIVDTKKPELFNLISSYKITKGGAALSIFKASDENLDQLYIETNFGKKFKPSPFYKDNYYASLLVWPLQQDRFHAKIVAIDKAGNISKVRLGFFLKDKQYKRSTIKVKDSFIDGKISDLASDNLDVTKNLNRIEKFKYVNETYRNQSNKLIEQVSSRVDKNRIDSFSLKPFYPLKNGKVVASYGDHRYYEYNGEIVSESYHMGLDLASIKMADIKVTNPGIVVFNEYNGIYGNNLIIYHGFGLYSLYAHCSNILVNKGDFVKAGEIVAKTGTTGLALGDHLHFGILIQGVDSRVAEWMDGDWIKVNIVDIIDSARKMIER